MNLEVQVFLSFLSFTKFSLIWSRVFSMLIMFHVSSNVSPKWNYSLLDTSYICSDEDIDRIMITTPFYPSTTPMKLKLYIFSHWKEIMMDHWKLSLIVSMFLCWLNVKCVVSRTQGRTIRSVNQLWSHECPTWELCWRRRSNVRASTILVTFLYSSVSLRNNTQIIWNADHQLLNQIIFLLSSFFKMPKVDSIGFSVSLLMKIICRQLPIK